MPLHGHLHEALCIIHEANCGDHVLIMIMQSCKQSKRDATKAAYAASIQLKWAAAKASYVANPQPKRVAVNAAYAANLQPTVEAMRVVAL